MSAASNGRKAVKRNRPFEVPNRFVKLDDKDNGDHPHGITVNEDCIDDVIAAITKRAPKYSKDEAENFARDIHDAVSAYIIAMCRVVVWKNKNKVVRAIIQERKSCLKILRRMRIAVEKENTYAYHRAKELLSPATHRDLWRAVAQIDRTAATDDQDGLIYQPLSCWGILFVVGPRYDRCCNILPPKEDAIKLFDLIIAQVKRTGRRPFPERDEAAAEVVFKYCQFMSDEPFLAPASPRHPGHGAGMSDRSGAIVAFVREVEEAYGKIDLVSGNSGAAWARINKLAVEKWQVSGAT
jgi:hypothetical protein